MFQLIKDSDYSRVNKSMYLAFNTAGLISGSLDEIMEFLLHLKFDTLSIAWTSVVPGASDHTCRAATCLFRGSSGVMPAPIWAKVSLTEEKTPLWALEVRPPIM